MAARSVHSVSARAAALAVALLVLPGLCSGAVGDEPGVSAHRLWLYAHLLLFVFWLGADLGVFLCARAAVRPGLSPEQRRRTVGLMNAIDMAPRISASLMLTVGGVLTEYVGLPHPWWQMAGIVLLGPAWLALILVRRPAAGDAGSRALLDPDQAVRLLLALTVPLSVAWSWASGRLDSAPYVGIKLLIFSGLMLAGFLLRRHWRSFHEALAALPDSASGDGVPERELVAAQRRTQPLVLVIWVGLAIAALIGVTQPGARNMAEPAVAASDLRQSPPR